jgi:hypothetical protein
MSDDSAYRQPDARTTEDQPTDNAEPPRPVATEEAGKRDGTEESGDDE